MIAAEISEQRAKQIEATGTFAFVAHQPRQLPYGALLDETLPAYSLIGPAMTLSRLAFTDDDPASILAAMVEDCSLWTTLVVQIEQDQGFDDPDRDPEAAVLAAHTGGRGVVAP